MSTNFRKIKTFISRKKNDFVENFDSQLYFRLKNFSLKLFNPKTKKTVLRVIVFFGVFFLINVFTETIFKDDILLSTFYYVKKWRKNYSFYNLRKGLEVILFPLSHNKKCFIENCLWIWSL